MHVTIPFSFFISAFPQNNRLTTFFRSTTALELCLPHMFRIYLPLSPHSLYFSFRVYIQSSYLLPVFFFKRMYTRCESEPGGLRKLRVLANTILGNVYFKKKTKFFIQFIRPLHVTPVVSGFFVKCLLIEGLSFGRI
jgi:hypothetical protein